MALDGRIIRINEERHSLFTQMNGILDGAEAEKRELTAEETSRYTQLEKDLDSKGEEVARAQALEARRADLTTPQRNANHLPGADEERPSGVADAKEYEKVFRSWLRHDASAGDTIAPEERAVLRRGYRTEERALATGTGSAGGYTIPTGFYNEIQQARALYGGMRAAPTRKMSTDTGNPLPIPTSNDTGNVGAILAENSTVPQQDVAFGQVNLGAYTYTSKLVLVPLQLLQDSAFELQTFLSGIFGERLGRAENAHLTSGDGSAKPTGLLTGLTVGYTGATTAAVAYDDLVETFHSVNPVYRQMPAASWMLNDDTLKVIRKVKDANGRPIWLPANSGSLTDGIPDSILGKPYQVNQDMPSLGAGNTPIAFGDLSNYWIRDVKEITLIRLNERYADNLQVGFFAFCRLDGKLINAGGNPVKTYKCAAS